MREREQAIAAHLPQVYSGRCRNISLEESAARAAAGEPFAVRLKIGTEPIRFTTSFAAQWNLPPMQSRTQSLFAPRACPCITTWSRSMTH